MNLWEGQLNLGGGRGREIPGQGNPGAGKSQGSHGPSETHCVYMVYWLALSCGCRGIRIKCLKEFFNIYLTSAIKGYF